MEPAIYSPNQFTITVYAYARCKGEFAVKKFKTLRGKLIFNSIVTLVAAMVVSVGVSAGLSYRGMEANTKQDLESIGKTAQIGISNSLFLMRSRIEAFGASSEIGNSGEPNGSWIKSIESKKDAYGYKALYVADRNGTIISSDEAYSGKSIADTEYYQKAKGGTTYLSIPMNDISGNLAVITAAQVTNNQFSGVVVGEMDPQAYSSIISSNVKIGKSGNVFIIDKNGTMIANTRPQLVAQKQNFIQMAKTDSKYASPAAVYKKMIAGKSGFDEYSYDNGTRACYYLPVTGSSGWSCGVVVPKSETMAEFDYIIVGMLIAAAILIVVGVFVTVKLADGVSRPIRACSERLMLLSQGDFHSEVPVVHEIDETGDLAHATAVLAKGLRGIIQDESYLLTCMAEGNFNIASNGGNYEGDLQPVQASIQQIIESLNSALLQINEASEQVANGSGQVSNASQLLSQGAATQASSIDELTKSIKNLSSDIRSNAENAAHSNEKAQKAEQELLEGSEQIKKLTAAMNGIKASSSKISKIIKTVESIAFQTNILSLNAAVEAARAGEAGKGFSVVADEVRNLAAKSAQASKETAQLIDEMAKAVENGVEITNTTGQKMISIVGDTREIISAVSSISTASHKQSDSIQQITGSMDQISSVIQTNSATAEESAAASEELSSEASEMQSLVGKFQLHGSEA